MNRRHFLSMLGLAGLAAVAPLSLIAAPSQPKRIGLTLDELNRDAWRMPPPARLAGTYEVVIRADGTRDWRVHPNGDRQEMRAWN